MNAILMVIMMVLASADAEHTPACAAKVNHYDISSKQFKWSMGGCGSNESITMYQVYSI